ncbi:MAG: HesA/MoeB/ThiF family protein [Geminicoccaceae bacterium]|nr:HesA/MoeB/ThiF family protein [Geminicoccaceae bacterium]
MSLDDDALRRYARHIVLPEVGGRGQERLLAAAVLVVGMGGLGAPLALYLAAAGIGRLGLVDDDVVASSNLHRQVLYTEADIGRPKVEAAAARLAAIAPACRVEQHGIRLDGEAAGELVAGYDVIVDGTDNAPTRRLVHDAAMRARRPLVSASVQGVDGQLTLYRAFAGPPHPCLHCLFGETEDDAMLPSCAQGGVLGPAAGLVGCLQAVAVVKLLLDLGPDLSGTLLLVEALGPAIERLSFARRPECAERCAHHAGW